MASFCLNYLSDVSTNTAYLTARIYGWLFVLPIRRFYQHSVPNGTRQWLVVCFADPAWLTARVNGLFLFELPIRRFYQHGVPDGTHQWPLFEWHELLNWRVLLVTVQKKASREREAFLINSTMLS
ncbi:hypothetical protein [Fulvivirga sedimenti]|uniref:Uncharacterized protein n=1 Tax=Fulvivirga sedimenti TaxID=2879465 RepID=A0A9X1HUB2_9BACT|nr:hypothetical protein [Fulvivirga sedimenti]MCA6078081.1 hypothetical protein [Fulvivirga sedimenti]